MANWQRRMIHIEPGYEQVDLTHGSVAYHGDGAMTIRYGGIRLRVGPCWLGDSHDEGPGQVPPDAILLAGLDLADLPEERGSWDPDMPIIAPPGIAEAVEAFGFRNVHALDPWCQLVLLRGDASITVTAFPTRLHATSEVSAMDAMLEFRSNADATPYRAYLSSGDATPDALDEIAARHSRFDLAIVSLPGTRLGDAVVGFDTDQAVEVVQRMRPVLTIPVHRFDDVFAWPRRDFQKAIDRVGREVRIRLVSPGTSHAFMVTPCADRISPMVSPGRVRDDPGLAMTT